MERDSSEDIIKQFNKITKEMGKFHKDFYSGMSSIVNVMKTLYDSSKETIKVFKQTDLLKKTEKQIKVIQNNLKNLYKEHEKNIDALISKANIKPQDVLKTKGDFAEVQSITKRLSDENDPERLKFIQDHLNLSTREANKLFDAMLTTRMDKLMSGLSGILGVDKGIISEMIRKFETEEAGLNKDLVKHQEILDKLKQAIEESKQKAYQAINYITDFAGRFFQEIDQGSAYFRKNMGLMTYEIESFQEKHLRLSNQLSHMGASYRDAVDAEIALNRELTGIVGQTDLLINKTIQWEKQFGIANDISGRFLKTLSSLRTTTSRSQVDMIGFAKAMSNASGIPLNQIMTDVANATDDVRLFMGQTEVSLIRAAVNAQMFGTSMNEIASTAKNLLNFETSITSELKASALLGRNIDFMRARQLAFMKDTKGMMEEIRRITKEVGFNELNVIQQKAFAQATGMSVEKLQTMLQREKDLEWIRSNGTKQQKEQLRALERMQKMRESEAEDIAKRASKEIDQIANQERMLKLQDSWNKMMKELIGPIIDKGLIPLMDKLVEYLPPILEYLKPISKFVFAIATGFIRWEHLTKIFDTLFTVMGKLIPKFSWLSKLDTIFIKTGLAILTLQEKLLSLGNVFKFIPKIGTVIATILGSFRYLKVLTTIIKMIPFIGHIFGLVESIVHLMMNFNKISEKFGGGLLGGLVAVGNEIVRWLIGPFAIAWDWIADWFIGKSPSKLGLGIVKGIKSIGSMLLDALVSPFKLWYKAVTGIWKNIATFIVNMTPNWVKKMLGFSSISSSGVVNTPVPVQQPQQATEVETKKPETKPVIDNNNYEMFVKYAQENNQILNNLSKILMNLNDLLVSGNIGINIDGTKLNNTLSNVRSNFGEYGRVSKIS